jgi:hypothetical protein
MKEAQYMIDSYERFQLEAPEKYMRQFEMAQLWCSQLLNAMAVVREKQTVTAN